MSIKQETKTLAEEARSILERMIVFNELDPKTMYSEKQLATNLGMGRTPVREALQKLAHDKMVVIHPRRGVQFPPVTVENQLKLLEVRRGLEPLCVKYATLRGSVEQKRKMLTAADTIIKAAEEGDNVQVLNSLRECHDLLAEATFNDYFTRVMSPLQGLSRRFWFVNLRNKDELLLGSTHTAAIMRSVARGDEKAAVETSGKLLDYLTEFSYNTLKMG